MIYCITSCVIFFPYCYIHHNVKNGKHVLIHAHALESMIVQYKMQQIQL